MKKTYNRGGDAAYSIKTEHIVTAYHFADALAKHCWDNGIEFDPKIKKREAMDILKSSLFQYGLSGSNDLTLYEGASDEAVAGYTSALPLATEWVSKNYPYLDKNFYDRDKKTNQ
jgi:hypothetical protein